MKKLNLILILVWAFISNTNAQYPDSITVKTHKVKGFGPFQSRMGIIQEMSKNNPWITTVHEYKGIPGELDHLMFATEQSDFMQHTYQYYMAGKINEERFNELKKAWKWNPDSSEYSKEFIKVDIGIAAGYDSDGVLKIKIDKNNNYDFSDDEYFTFPEKVSGQNFWGRYNDSQPFEVSYEFFDGEKKTASAWVYLDYSSFEYNNPERIITPIQLSFAFAQHHLGEFEVNGEKYYIAIKSDRAVFRNFYTAKVWNEETKNKISNSEEGIQNNGQVRIGEYYYRLGSAGIDGSSVLLIKDASVEEKGGNEVGMRAINIAGESITGEKIELSGLSGNIVLLDFWGTWCGPCRGEIPKLKSIYEQYKNKNFKIIGIAKDHLETLNKFVAENEIEWTQIVQENDKSIIRDYNVVSYPTTFLIDTNGKILAKGLRSEELAVKLEEIFSGK